MPITLYEKIKINIDTTKYSKDDTKAVKGKAVARNLTANIKAQTANTQTTQRKYSRSSNNRRRNG